MRHILPNESTKMREPQQKAREQGVQGQIPLSPSPTPSLPTTTQKNNDRTTSCESGDRALIDEKGGQRVRFRRIENRGIRHNMCVHDQYHMTFHLGALLEIMLIGTLQNVTTGREKNTLNSCCFDQFPRMPDPNFVPTGAVALFMLVKSERRVVLSSFDHLRPE